MSKDTRGLVALIAGFAAIGFGVLALFYWAAIITPAFSFSNTDWTLKILAIAAIISLAIYLITSPESVGQTLGRRSTRLTANALVAAIVAIGIGVVVNIITDNVQAVRADLTAGSDFTISPQTVKVLKDLEAQNKTVNAIGFFYQASSQQTAQDLLNAYHAITTHFRYQIVDPSADPMQAAQYGIHQDGTVVFTDGKNRQDAKAVGEREFTGAIAQLLDTSVKKVAFLTGHGERDIQGTDTRSYATASQSLQLDNYTTIKWSLTTSPTLPVNDVTVLVIAEPTSPLGTREVQTIQSYLDAGGHALVLLDPEMTTDVLTSLAPILSKYGITSHEGVVFDLDRILNIQNPSPAVFAVDSYPASPITEDLSAAQRITTFFGALAVTPPTSTVTTTVATTLLQTSGGPPTSWLESLPANSQYDAGKELAGPISIGVSIGPPDTSTDITDTRQVKTRLVVYGDADFPSDLVLSPQSAYYNASNGDLFANTVSWLAGANELVSIRKKDPTAPRTLVLDNGQKNVQLITAVFGLPLFVLLLGGAIWWRRK